MTQSEYLFKLFFSSEPKQILEEVSEYASKEYSLERTLDKMANEWQGVKFEYSEWRDTGTCILKALDETQMLLDDQIVKTQSMRASPFIGPFEERVKVWEKRLKIVQVTYLISSSQI